MLHYNAYINTPICKVSFNLRHDDPHKCYFRYLRSSVSHFLRGGRAPSGTSHFLRGRRSYGLVNAWLTNNGNEDIEEEDEDPIYQRGVRNSVSHFLRGRR